MNSPSPLGIVLAVLMSHINDGEGCKNVRCRQDGAAPVDPEPEIDPLPGREVAGRRPGSTRFRRVSLMAFAGAGQTDAGTRVKCLKRKKRVPTLRPNEVKPRR